MDPDRQRCTSSITSRFTRRCVDVVIVVVAAADRGGRTIYRRGRPRGSLGRGDSHDDVRSRGPGDPEGLPRRRRHPDRGPVGARISRFRAASSSRSSGASGSGKSTLLQLLGALDERPRNRVAGGEAYAIRRPSGWRPFATEDRFVFQFITCCGSFRRSRTDDAAPHRRPADRPARAKDEELLARSAFRSYDASAGQLSGASSSGWRSRVRSPPTRSSYWRTSRAETSTITTASACTISSPRSRGIRGRLSSRDAQPAPRRPGRSGSRHGGRTARQPSGNRGDAVKRCEQCHEREAVVNLTQIVDDRSQAASLRALRGRKGRRGSAVMKSPLGDFLAAMGKGIRPGRRGNSGDGRCERCGASRRISARRGASAAPIATELRAEASRAAPRLHARPTTSESGTQHRPGRDDRRCATPDDLREQLRLAIETENFELRGTSDRLRVRE